MCIRDRIHPYSVLTDFIAVGFHLSSIINACISSSVIPCTVPYSPLTLVVRYQSSLTPNWPSSCDLVTLFKQPLHPAQSCARMHTYIPHIHMPRGAPVTLHTLTHTDANRTRVYHEIATSAISFFFLFFIHSTHNPARGADGARVAGVRWPSVMHGGGEGVARNRIIA